MKHKLINQTSGNTEYYTPPEIVDAARRVMGYIDLDPASSEKANRIVRATKIYTKQQNGLTKKWYGKVWMNHPYGKSENPCTDNCKKETCRIRGFHSKVYVPGNNDWIDKLVDSYLNGMLREACCITYASTSEQWFQPLMIFPQCFLAPRTNYILPNGKVKNGVTKGSVVTYLGENKAKFIREFRKLGCVKVAG